MHLYEKGGKKLASLHVRKVDSMFFSFLFVEGAQRTLHVLHNSEQPASAFAILESGNKVVPLIADGLFDLLMYKMSSVYTNKMQKMESKGPRFEIGDFCVKLGSVSINQNFKGVLVEVSDIYKRNQMRLMDSKRSLIPKEAN